MSRDNYWTNDDGLQVGFGVRGASNVSAVEPSIGGTETIRTVIDLTTVEATPTVAALEGAQFVRIPRGTVVTAARIIPTVTAVGATATFDFGSYDAEDITTADDADGIFSAIGVASLAVGTITAGDGVSVTTPVSLGTGSDTDVILVPSYNTAAFTAGELIIEVEVRRPSGSGNLTNGYQIAV